jgi:hypothetical protein
MADTSEVGKETLTRLELIAFYKNFVGPPVVQPAVGIMERQIARYERACERFADEFMKAFPEVVPTPHAQGTGKGAGS